MLREFFGEKGTSLEKKIEVNEKKFQDLLIKVAEMDRETDEIFAQLEVTPAQINQFLSDEKNFSQECWDEIQRQMAEIDKKATTCRDISQVRRAYKERAEIQRQWIFVR